MLDDEDSHTDDRESESGSDGEVKEEEMEGGMEEEKKRGLFAWVVGRR